MSYHRSHLSGTAQPQGYGHQLAAKILATRPSKRQLKLTLESIDPTLWRRCTECTSKLARAGSHPAVALRNGLARAISMGVLAGRGNYPKNRRDLGGTYVPMGADIGIKPQAGVIAAALTPTVLPTKGQCTSDGAFIWDISATGTGYWRRLRVGEKCTSVYAGDATINQRQGTTTAPGVTAAVPFMSGTNQQGPFWLIYKNNHPQPQTGYIDSPSKLPPDWLMFFNAVALAAGTTELDTHVFYNPYDANHSDGLATYKAWLAAFNLPDPGPGKMYRVLPPTVTCPSYSGDDPYAGSGPSPCWVFKDGQDTWYIGAELAIPPDIYVCPDTDHAAGMRQAYPNQPVGLLITVWKPDTGYMPDWMNEIAKDVNNTIGAFANALGQTVCQAAHDPKAFQAATKSGNPYVIAGLAAASLACPTPSSAPQPPAVTQSFPILPLAIAGGALVLISILTSPKKKKTPSASPPKV